MYQSLPGLIYAHLPHNVVDDLQGSKRMMNHNFYRSELSLLSAASYITISVIFAPRMADMPAVLPPIIPPIAKPAFTRPPVGMLSQSAA